MPKYHYHELARWEGEGGSPGELMPSADPIERMDEQPYPRKRSRQAPRRTRHVRRRGLQPDLLVHEKRD